MNEKIIFIEDGLGGIIRVTKWWATECAEKNVVGGEI
jgi:hypothetical protein